MRGVIAFKRDSGGLVTMSRKGRCHDVQMRVTSIAKQNPALFESGCALLSVPRNARQGFAFK
jgi:hypothetical protein